MGLRVLVMRVGSRAYAVPIAHVVETMRPLDIEPMAGAPPSVAGVAIIRGAATPVIDLATLVGLPPCTTAPKATRASSETRSVGRFVTLRLAGRTVALAVESVVGVRELSDAQLGTAPPLLQDALAGIVDGLGTLDAELLFVLRAARLVADDLGSVRGA